MIRYQKKSSTKNSTSKGLVSAKLVEEKFTPYSNFINNLFFILGAYLVLPLYDVPFLGLSISAPIMYMIAVVCLINPPVPWLHTYRRWIFLAVAIWIGVFISTAANGILSYGQNANAQELKALLQYLYWMIVFIITVYFASQGQVLKKMTTVLGWSVLVLALIRWAEAIFLNKIGAWSGTYFLTQNNYGVLFSMFSPFLLIMVFKQRGWKRLLSILGNLTLWGAAAINGSRGSWVSIATGLGVTVILFFLTNPKKFSGILIFMLITASLAIILWGAFPQIAGTVEQRFSTFENLDEDKSALVRELMVQKGIRLFKDNPIFGIGAGHFTQESVSLVLPDLLSPRLLYRYNKTSSHNSYIQYLAEFGLAGSIPLALLLITLAFQGSRTTMKALRVGNVVPLPIILSFFQMSLHMYVISSITNTGTWFIYGLVGAAIMSYRKTNEDVCA